MNITSFAVSDEAALLYQFRYKTTLFKNPNINPYLNAEISVRTVQQSDICPAQTYVYATQLNFMRQLDECLQSRYRIDFLKQRGFITYVLDGLPYTLYPPIVEYVDGVPLLIDGTHRITYANGRKGDGKFTAVFIKGVAENLKPSYIPSPVGWPGVQEFANIEAVPPGYKKRIKRYKTDELYQYYFRLYKFPGITKITRSSTGVNLDEAALLAADIRNQGR